MDLLVTLGRTLGFSFAAGINLYATVAILGLASRFHWVALPPQFRVFDNNWVIGAALVCYAIEFVADKVPWVDTAWDAVHTVIRPIGGAFIAVTTLGEASPGAQAAAALLGGGVALASHVTKRRRASPPTPRRNRSRTGRSACSRMSSSSASGRWRWPFRCSPSASRSACWR